jgi:cyclin-dependent kinase-like
MQNKYEVLEVVGEGAYGIVYKCRNKETGKFVAIKKFKEVEDELVKKTMKRELRMLQRMHHENIVDFVEAFKRKGNLFLVFEYVEKNLLEILQDSPRGLEPKLIRHFMYQLCKAIKYLHDQNVIHRDVKPENLLVNENMDLKLCDFGFARLISGSSKERLTDYVATRWYRAPELLLTQGEYGPEVDYWAIGCIMGELVDGNPLFPGENEIDQLHCIQKVLGNFTDEQVYMFYANPIYSGKDLLEVDKPETLEWRYLGKLPKNAISFMKGLLELDPKKRLNGVTVFQHPYLAKLVEKDMKKNNDKIADANDNVSNNNLNNNGNNSNTNINNLNNNNVGNNIQVINNNNGNTNIQVISNSNNINTNININLESSN